MTSFAVSPDVPRARAAAVQRAVRVPGTAMLFAGLWAWATWSCAEHWRGNPNYSYGWVVPILALVFGFRRYAAGQRNGIETGSERPIHSNPRALVVALCAGSAVFGLEFARQQMWHPQIVLEIICLAAVGFSFLAFTYESTPALARSELFPILFFLTAVPWPARLEQPVTSALMQWVANATTEILH